MNFETQNPDFDIDKATSALPVFDAYQLIDIRNTALQTAISSLRDKTSDFNGEVIPLARVIEEYLLNG